MPGPNSPYTNLDSSQVLRQSFDELNDRIRVDIGANIEVGGDLEIAIIKDEDSITAWQGGTWNLNNISGTISLPTGASTEAKQDDQIILLNSIDDKILNNYGASSEAIRTASQIGNTVGPADFSSGTTSSQTLRTSSNITRNGTELSYNVGTTDANTLRVNLPTDQTPIPTTQSGVWTTGRTWTLSSGTDSVELSDYKSSTGTVTATTRSATVQTALAANSSRKSYLLWNDTGANCFVKFGTGATTADFSIRLSANSGYEPPGTLRYTGIITVIWGTGGAGNLLVTEFT